MKIILSNTSKGAFKGMLEILKSRSQSGAKHIIIAPDRFTAYIEREVMEYLKLESVFDIQVTSFTRLAIKCLGSGCKRCLTPEGSVMLLAEVLNKNRDKLEYYKNAAAMDGFASELYAAVTEIRNSGISAVELRGKAEKMPPHLAAKSRDIAFIYDEYLKSLVEKYTDSTTRLQALAEYLNRLSPTGEYLAGEDYSFDYSEKCSADSNGGHAAERKENRFADSDGSGAGGSDEKCAADICVCRTDDTDNSERRAADGASENKTLCGAPDAPEICATHFYVIDFNSFTAPEMEIIAALDKSAMSMSVGLIYGFDNPNARIYPKKTLNRLKNAVKDKAEIVYYFDAAQDINKIIAERLFSYEKCTAPAQNNGRIAVYGARDRYEEVLRLALEIINKVRAGARYKDAEVYCASLEDYSHEIKSVFSRYNIPFFIDEKQPLAEQTKVRYLLSAVAVVRSGFRRAEIIDFVKNPLFYKSPSFIKALSEGCLLGADEDKPDFVKAFNAVAEFENFMLKLGIPFVQQRKIFQDFKAHGKSRIEKAVGKNRNGTAEETENVNPSIENLNVEAALAEIVRKQIFKVLEPLYIRGTAGAGRFVNGAREFLDNADEAWRRHVENLNNLSAYYVKCAEQVDDKILSVFDEIETVLNENLDIGGFEAVLKSMFKTLKIALVPTYLDCVFIGGEESRFMGKGDMAVLGANSGKFPSYSGSGVVITEKDSDALARFGVDINPDNNEKLAARMLSVCEILSKPRGSLSISFAREGGEGELRMSSVLSELRGLVFENGKPLEILPVRFDDIVLLEKSEREKMCGILFSTEKAAFHAILNNALASRTRPAENIIYGSAYLTLGEADKRKLDNAFDFPEKIRLPENSAAKGSVSVSRLENFYSCPYGHYFKYILSLKRRKEAKFEGGENGIIFHFVLEKFFGSLKNRDKYQNLPPGETAAAIKRDCDKYFERAVIENDFSVFLEKPDTARILGRLKEEIADTAHKLYFVYRRSQFKPAFLECRFGDGKFAAPELIFGNQSVKLKGVIDRVDICGDKFVVIDYKTYKSVDFSYKEIYYGRRVQLYVYMKAVENALKLKPAGLFYLPLFSNYTKESENRLQYTGHALLDEDTLRKIDGNFATGADDCVIKEKRDKNNKLNADAYLSETEFDAIGEYVLALGADAFKHIADGYIKPVPADGCCEFCDYASICAFKPEEGRKNGTVKKESFYSDEADISGAETGGGGDKDK